MRARNALALAIIAVVTAMVCVLAFTGLSLGGKQVLSPLGDRLSLGLDLKGGVYTVFRADPESAQEGSFDALLEATSEVLRTRLTDQGYTEANVSLQGSDCIRIEIPEVSDPREVVELIGTPALLQFVDPNGNVIMEGKDIVEVAPAMNPEDGQYVVRFKLNSQATKAFSDATARLIGRSISIVLDGEVISAPTVSERIGGGEGNISFGAMGTQESFAEARRLSTLIMSGALPLSINETETRAISATLGEDAISKALTAGLIGLGLVLLFMLVMYRLPGLMADVALIWYVILVFFLLGALGIQLTLPGIAGILLGIGMAVDANVVIFERFREELKNGRSYESALKAGFKNALSAIIDSNVTTLIAAFVLMYYGTGPVKGFSYTLALSVVVSMFTAVFVTRFLLRRAVRLGLTGKGLYTRPFRERKTLPIMKRSGLTLLVPAVILVVALVMTLVGAGLTPGIDFTGGSIVEYSMGGEFATADVGKLLSENGFNDVQLTKVAAEDGSMTHLQVRLKLDEDDKEQSEETSSAQLSKLNQLITGNFAGAEYRSMEYAGAVSSAQLIKNALKSILAAMVLMLIYIAIRFDLFSGAAALFGLLHDVALMVAGMCLAGAFFQVNSSFIAALLTIVGYSINDTIVVFDRIREYKKQNARLSGGEIVDAAVSASMSRTINTSITTLLTLLALFIFGSATIREFTFPLIVGMVAGTYSSNLLSGPIWARLMKLRERRQAKRPARAQEGEEDA